MVARSWDLTKSPTLELYRIPVAVTQPGDTFERFELGPVHARLVLNLPARPFIIYYRLRARLKSLW